MSKAVNAHTTSAPSPERPDADARLASLLAQLLRQDEAIEAILDEGRLLGPGGITPASEDQEHRLDLACDVRSGIVGEIIETPATTQAGRAAKAQALLALLGSEVMNADETLEDRLAFALAVDVLAAGDDARLIQLCALFHQQHAVALAAPDDDDDAIEETMDARWRTSDQIEEIHPVTLAGMKAKAKVATVLFEEAGLVQNGSTARFALSALRDAAGEARA